MGDGLMPVFGVDPVTGRHAEVVNAVLQALNPSCIGRRMIVRQRA